MLAADSCKGFFEGSYACMHALVHVVLLSVRCFVAILPTAGVRQLQQVWPYFHIAFRTHIRCFYPWSTIASRGFLGTTWQSVRDFVAEHGVTTVHAARSF